MLRLPPAMRAGGLAVSVLFVATLGASCSSGSSSSDKAGPNDRVIAAAGDIACDPASAPYNYGAGTGKLCHQRLTGQLLDRIHNFTAVLPLGDDQYERGTLSAFQTSYAPTWGRYFDKSYPTPGNHEYLTRDAQGYYAYWGARAGDPTKGYYSFDLGKWHLISLNSNCSPAGGCKMDSPQEKWLRADLAAHRNRCTLAYWHQPRFSSGEHGDEPRYDVFWRDLDAAHADIVLNGHDHDYERFKPQNAAGRPKSNGIREFVVGTGGRNLRPFFKISRNSLVRNTGTYGVLVLTLHPSSYSWRFQPEPHKRFTDSGRGACH
jgi:calcineurin-like phosphoesterase family protein